jgi:hypothetical protein
MYAQIVTIAAFLIDSPAIRNHRKRLKTNNSSISNLQLFAQEGPPVKSNNKRGEQQEKRPSFPGGALGRMGVVSCLMLFEPFSYGCDLPMAAAVTAASVEAATTTVEAATAVNRSAAEAAADCAATSETTTVKATTSETTTVEPAPETTSAEAAAEPRAGTDEQTTGEPARTVVTVRRAGVGVIPIVSVGADRS